MDVRTDVFTLIGMSLEVTYSYLRDCLQSPWWNGKLTRIPGGIRLLAASPVEWSNPGSGGTGTPGVFLPMLASSSISGS